MSIAASMIADILSAIPGAAARVRFEDHEIEDAICVGTNAQHRAGDDGLFAEADIVVRYRLSDEPESWRAGTDPHITGRVVQIARGAGDFEPLRAVERVETLGMVRLSLAREHTD